MPETSQKHNDDEVDRGSGPANAVPAQGNIKIIAQKGGKRDVPAPPEIRETDSRVRKTEVILEMKTEAKSRTNRAGGITGEIEKDLTGKGEDAHPGIERDEGTSVTKDSVGCVGKHRVSEHDFFEQAECHEQQSPHKLTHPQAGGSDKLGQKITGTDDRSGDELREKGNSENEISQ